MAESGLKGVAFYGGTLFSFFWGTERIVQFQLQPQHLISSLMETRQSMARSSTLILGLVEEQKEG